MRFPLLAAISLEREGGGVALVARLIWQALQDRFGDSARLVTLLGSGQYESTATGRAAFAGQIVGRELLGATDFVLFSHLDLTRVHTVLPSALRRPYGVFLHGIEAWNGLSDFHARALQGARVRIANSSFTAARVMQRHPAIGPVVVCPLALPPSRETAMPAPIAGGSRSLGEHVVLVVGRMDERERYKGHDELIDAWPAVVSAIPDAKLVVVGHGSDTERLRGKASTSSARASIVFTGFVSDEALDGLYEQAAVFALPSRGEGFGLVYLEAMTHRLPCVGSVHDAAAEVIQDRETGVLTDPSQPGALERALVTLLANRELRARLGNAGYLRATEHFGFDAFASRLVSLIQ